MRPRGRTAAGARRLLATVLPFLPLHPPRCDRHDRVGREVPKVEAVRALRPHVGRHPRSRAGRLGPGRVFDHAPLGPGQDWPLRSRVLPLLRGGGPLQAPEAGRLQDLVLARRRGRSHRRRVLPAVEKARGLLQGRSGGALENAQHPALLSEAPRSAGLLRQVAGDTALSRDGAAKPVQLRPVEAAAQATLQDADRPNGPGMERHPGRTLLSAGTLVRRSRMTKNAIKSLLVAPLRAFLQGTAALRESARRLYSHAALAAQLKPP